jgi:5-histidylcysteine sulfoxide synthase/putative 4-mercaptohistidine N1-methyltranferase
MNPNPLFYTKTPLLNEGNPEAKREELLEYFHKTFDIDEHLFEVFADQDAMYRKADPLRHPLIFYYGHTATFYINKLIISKILDNRIDSRLESMFAIGVDEMSWDDLNTSHYDWPTVAEVTEYRNKVRQTIDHLIKTLPLHLPIGWNNPFWIILMGIEHERIHLETSSVLIRQIPLRFLKPINSWIICPETGSAPENTLLPVAGKQIKIGKSFNASQYGWDNEYGIHDSDVQSFKASKYLCSNGEFLQFVEAGGYLNQNYWTEEGWNWKIYTEANHPLFWIKDGDDWKLRLVFNEMDMPWNWPVETNYLEAKAFCNWKTEQSGMPVRLPSEDEWFLLCKNANVPDQPFWEKAPGNINMEHFQSPCPVDKFKFDQFYDLTGNVWQWSETPISGFEGFKIHPVYDDFSTPTFDMKHNLIKGGSWISTGNEATLDARYAFRRHFYQHAGFRYVESPNEVVIPQSIYETDREVTRHCEAQYGGDHLGIKNYYGEIARLAIQYAGNSRKNALDLGCRTGRTTFELAKEFDSVTGLDFTARNIRVAGKLQGNGNLNFVFPEEGELLSYHQINISALGLDNCVGKVTFLQSDASNMKPIFVGYDLVLINDILDQMYNPRHFLTGVHKRINAGGRLIIATGFDWSEECTKLENWVGGHREGGEQIWGEDDLASLLSETFTKVDGPIILPSVTRINKRKFSYNNLEVTIWEKKIS